MRAEALALYEVSFCLILLIPEKGLIWTFSCPACDKVPGWSGTTSPDNKPHVIWLTRGQSPVVQDTRIWSLRRFISSYNFGLTSVPCLQGYLQFLSHFQPVKHVMLPSWQTFIRLNKNLKKLSLIYLVFNSYNFINISSPLGPTSSSLSLSVYTILPFFCLLVEFWNEDEEKSLYV